MEDIISNIYEEHKLITLLPTDDKEETINIKDIRFIEVVNGKKELLCFHVFNHSCFCRGKLTTWTSKLKEYDFFQCHRAFLVNMAHIHYFTPKNATMDNATMLYAAETLFTYLFPKHGYGLNNVRNTVEANYVFMNVHAEDWFVVDIVLPIIKQPHTLP
jgi:hypothetical protein